MKGNYRTNSIKVATLQAKPWEVEGRTGVSHKLIMEADLVDPAIKISEDLYTKMGEAGVVGKEVILDFRMKYDGRSNGFVYEVTGFEIVE